MSVKVWVVTSAKCTFSDINHHCMPRGLIISRELAKHVLHRLQYFIWASQNLLQARFLVSFLISILPSDKKVESQEPLHKSGHECVYLRDFNRAAINGFWSSSKYSQWISSWVTAFCSFFPFSFFPDGACLRMRARLFTWWVGWWGVLIHIRSNSLWCWVQPGDWKQNQVCILVGKVKVTKGKSTTLFSLSPWHIQSESAEWAR